MTSSRYGQGWLKAVVLCSCAVLFACSAKAAGSAETSSTASCKKALTCTEVKATSASASASCCAPAASGTSATLEQNTAAHNARVQQFIKEQAIRGGQTSPTATIWLTPVAAPVPALGGGIRVGNAFRLKGPITTDMSHEEINMSREERIKVHQAKIDAIIRSHQGRPAGAPMDQLPAAK